MSARSFVLAAGIWFTLAGSAAADSLTFVSERGDWVGGGQARTFTSADSTFTAEVIVDNEIKVYVDPPGEQSGWTLRLRGPHKTLPVPGTYSRAETIPPDSLPLLDVTGENRGCSSVVSRYEVRDLDLSPDGDVTRLWVLFDQACGDLTPGMVGELRFGTVDTTAPVLARWRSLDLGDAVTRPVTFTATGTAPMRSAVVTGDNAAAFPIVADGCAGRVLTAGAQCRVDVRYTPSEPGVATATLWIPAGPTWHPVPLQANAFGGTTKVELHSQPDDPAGDGQDFTWDPSNALMRASLFEGRLASITMQVPGARHFVSVGAAPGSALTPGAYVSDPSGPTPSPELRAFLDLYGYRCDDRHGTFVVGELTTWPDGTLRSYGAAFEQRCGTSPGAMTGTVAFRQGDTTPTPPWEPTDVAASGPRTADPVTGSPPADVPVDPVPLEPPFDTSVPPAVVPTVAPVPTKSSGRTESRRPRIRVPTSVARRALRRGIVVRLLGADPGARIVARRSGRRLAAGDEGSGRFRVRFPRSVARTARHTLRLRIAIRTADAVKDARRYDVRVRKR